MAEAIEITPEELRKIQLLQVKILKEIDSICRKHNIKYTLCGGSMLGAIRHKGFIPWDDDIDISMLREEYEKFLLVCKEELNSEVYFLQTMETDLEYRLLYSRVLLKGTSFVRAGQEHIKAQNGIFVDIFPRDGQSDNRVIAFIQSRLAYLARKILYSPVGALRSKSLIGRMAFKVLRCFGRGTAEKIIKIVCKLNFNKETEIVKCWGLMSNGERRRLEMGKRGYKKYCREIKTLPKEKLKARKERNRGLKRRFFTDIIEVPFEDMMVMITSEYDIWLRYNYDDYMQLPPKEKQKIHQTVSSYSLGNYV